MGPHDVILASPVFGSCGLPIRRRRDYLYLAGVGDGTRGKEAQYGVPTGEPYRHRRRFELDVGAGHPTSFSSVATWRGYYAYVRIDTSGGQESSADLDSDESCRLDVSLLVRPRHQKRVGHESAYLLADGLMARFIGSYRCDRQITADVSTYRIRWFARPTW